MSNKPTPTESIASYVLALVIAIVGAVVLANAAACDQHDSFCAFTGSDK
jgi:hypothetical protein